MATIGIIGANGQVGSEVCLFLRQRAEVTVIPICRSELGSAFLRRCGLTCRHGSLDEPEEARRLLSGCDVVADFSLPGGLPSRVRAVIRTNIAHAISEAPPAARFVYISSLMACGMGARRNVFRRYWLAHTVYGASKRFGEGLARKIGRQAGKEVYVLRLGQVHGLLQGVSRAIARNIRNETTYVPEGPSYTVFAYSIAEALCHIAAGRERPGCYLLVSVPEWSWQELHDYYARRAGIQPPIVLLPVRVDAAPVWSWNIWLSVRRTLFDALLRLATRYREEVAWYLGSRAPRIEQRFTALSRTRTAGREVRETAEFVRYSPYAGQFHGRAVGRRLTTLSDSRLTMGPAEREVAELLQKACGAL